MNIRRSEPDPKNDLRFEFGRNWRSYVTDSLNQSRIDAATRSLVEMTGRSSLQGELFLDVGCGSGVFSLAAYHLGATVYSFDRDPVSVECCRRLQHSVGSPARWLVLEGSILDPELDPPLPRCDIVYAWGVLHHTGSMWDAMRSAASLLKPGGLLCVAIYNKVESRLTGSQSWRRVKRLYNTMPRPLKPVMEVAYGALKSGALVATLRNPMTVARNYHERRGMSLWHDWIDWLGGFPYEFASAGEVFTFCQNELGLRLMRLNTTSTIGCNEFVFMKPLPTVPH